MNDFNNLSIIYDLNLFDHFPFHFNLNIVINDRKSKNINNQNNHSEGYINWNNFSKNDHFKYKSNVEYQILSNESIYRNVLDCNNVNCNDINHNTFLDNLFEFICVYTMS